MMDISSETTPLTQENSGSQRSSASILKPNRSKWIALVVVLLVGLIVFFAASNYKGPNRNPTTNNNLETETTTTTTALKTNSQPNIIWFIADDLGRADISWHGSEISTPNIDSLAQNGIELTSHYVMPLCSPSRASFLTGRHSFRMGVQATMSDLVKPQSIAHIPSSYTLAAEYFKNAGYKTAAYGKWHVGYAKESYTPTKRGFDHHTGFYQFAIDYNSKYTLDSQYGYDWFSDGNVDWDAGDESLYTTFILTDAIEQDLTNHASSESTDPLFLYLAFQNPHFLVGVPDDFESDCEMIKDDDRRSYCAHVQALDFAVGRVIDSLKANNLYDNSIIAFSTDNGVLAMNLCGNPGGHSAAGSAYPLRGGKYTLFEGGINTPAFISGNLVPSELQGTSSDTWFQAADWLPTLLHFTNDGSDAFYNAESKNTMIDYYEGDGYDMYSVLFDATAKGKNMRKENDGYMVINLDYKEELGGYVDTAIIYKGYKMIYNHELYLTASCDVYSAKPGSFPFTTTVNDKVTAQTNYNNMYLFDLDNDKSETNDLLGNQGRLSKDYKKYSALIDEMFEILDKEKDKGYMSQQDKSTQSDGDSSNFDGAWMPWLDESESEFVPKETDSGMMGAKSKPFGKEFEDGELPPFKQADLH